jgi:transcriptional regulator with XRE-family HTH domain
MDKRHYNHTELQKFREKLFTQEQLAKQLNKHVKTISRAETGKSASFKLLAEITSACGKSVKEIIYETPLAK